MRFFWCILMTLIVSSTARAEDRGSEQETAIYSAMSMGTGWAVTRRHIVTNYHVIKGMNNLRLVTSDRREIPLKVVTIDKLNDLAILLVQDKKIEFKPLPISLRTPRFGTQVFTIGYPHPNLMGVSPKLTSGVVNAKSGLADDPRMLQVSVPVQSGNSGGPLINMKGEVVGIITSKLSAQKVYEKTGDLPQNVNFAVKMSRLNLLISELETDEPVKTGGAKKKQELAVLASKVVDSVNIVAGDSKKQVDNSKYKVVEKKRPPRAVDRNSDKTIVVYSYAEPGYYDMEEDIPSSNTVASYSKSTMELLKKQLKIHLGNKVNFVSNSGEKVNSTYYDLFDAAHIQQICNENNASNIVASKSDRDPGADFRWVTYRVIDCDTSKEYRKQYKIERDDTYDSFGYEVGLNITFKDFILKIPPYANIDWVGL